MVIVTDDKDLSNSVKYLLLLAGQVHLATVTSKCTTVYSSCRHTVYINIAIIPCTNTDYLITKVSYKVYIDPSAVPTGQCTYITQQH